MKIIDVEKITGLPAKTIKYYEEQQLIAPQRNKANGYREYTDDDIKILKQVKLLRKLGFTIDNIKTILDSPKQFKDVFHNHIAKIDMSLKTWEKAKEICKDILLDNVNADNLDFAKYLETISNMEEEGFEFMDENVKVKKFKKDSQLTLYFLVAFILFIIVFVFLILKGWIALGVGLMAVICMLFFLVARHSKTTGYICKACEKRFDISALVDFISPQFIGSKYLKCPHCGKRTWANESYKD